MLMKIYHTAVTEVCTQRKFLKSYNDLAPEIMKEVLKISTQNSSYNICSDNTHFQRDNIKITLYVLN